MTPSTPDDARKSKQSLWSRLRTTPLGDLVRGKLTGRLDLRTAIDAADLPAPLSEIVVQKASSKWRWSTGRLEYAQNLANRMRGELDAGRTTEDLTASLSDPKQFAQFVSQAKPRKTFWSRLVHTPLRDALRGRLTARLDVRSAIAEAGLAEPLSGLILSVTRRTRLWRAEKVDVAQELRDHFQDGIAAGRTPEQLVASFGDARQAAKLIRRAKLRGRPLAWRAWRRAWQAMGISLAVVIAGYLFFWARYSLARPTLAHNYALEITAPARAVPEKDRAWPHYREALLSMTATPKDGEKEINVSEERPGSKHWEQVQAWLQENQTALAEARTGAALPALGFVYGDPGDKAWYEHEHIRPEGMNLEQNPELIGLLLPHLQQLRALARLLEADAHRAAAEGDRQSFVHDVKAILGMSEQVQRDLPFLVVELIGFTFLRSGLTLVDEALANQPALLGDDDLQRLAHTIAAIGNGGRLQVRLDGERAFLRDIYQRIYTDNGNGDGHLAARSLEQYWVVPNHGHSKTDELADLFVYSGPTLSAFMLSRRPMTELTESLLDRMESDLNRPMWKWQKSIAFEQTSRWRESRLETARHLPIVMLLPAIETAAIAGEFATQRRDATLVALALELYHRRHATWPKQLSDLTPDLLPSVPPDRYTGQPMQYRLVDGRPLLYSFGPDRDDDSGKSLEHPDANVRFYPPPTANDSNPPIPNGDWILWPPQLKAEATEIPVEQPE